MNDMMDIMIGFLLALGTRGLGTKLSGPQEPPSDQSSLQPSPKTTKSTIL